MPHFDAIVIGCGGVGSATLLHLARRGLRVLGLDRFPPPHDRGSSHGRTRMIRQAYFEHPDYVPLVLRAYRLWAELEAAVGQTLYRETGLLEIGPPQGDVVPGVLAAARQHQLAVDELSAEEIARRFPGFRVPAGMVGVFERRAGFLHVEHCVQAHLTAAIQVGAVLRQEAVREWQVVGGNGVVTTERERYEAPRVVITAGSWAGQLLADLGVPLVVRRKPQYWFATRTGDYNLAAGSPSFLYETADGANFYGFPVVGPEGLKCAEHTGGAVIDDPLALSREIDRADLARVSRFLGECLPGVTTTVNDHAPCMYTMSPDANFIVDRHPQFPRIAFAAGLSGHGFKFTPVLGEALADLATTGATALPIGFLGLQRFCR